MSALRIRTPGGGIHDRDLGPSGHTRNGTGFVFYLLHEQPTSSDKALLARRKHDRERLPRPASMRGPRCGKPMPKAGTVCAMKAGHKGDNHKSREAMDRALAGYRA